MTSVPSLPCERERRIEAAAAEVVEIYHGLAEDANDGEVALWSQTDLIVAIVALGKALDIFSGEEGTEG